MTDAVLEKTTGAETVIWDLSDLYAGVDDPKIDTDMTTVAALIDDFAATYKGKVADLDVKGLVAAMRALETIYDLRGRLGSFASLTFTTDTSDPKIGALRQKISEFGAQVGQKLVFFDLEWNDLPQEHVMPLISDPALAFCKHYLESERRFKPYQLSEVEEQILMEKSVTGNQAWTRFFSQLMSAARYEVDGESLNQSKLLKLMFEQDRDLRHRAADALTKGLNAKSMELSYIFNVLAADKATDDRRRGYETWVSSRNLSNKAPDSVVDALVNTVTSNYDLVARHYDIKRHLLGYEELYDYDRYAPVPIKSGEKTYTWEEARDLVLKAFNAFSPQMAEVAKKFFDGNWIHAAILPNKSGGAYASWVVPSVHPYIFVNYNGTANDVMTLAHELGHGIHMYLSRDQGIFALATPLTTAEMASTFAEMLVFSDLMSREEDPEARLALLTSKIEDSFGTIFRQISMNRFEDAMHNARRDEGELTHARLSEIWLDVQRDMYGDSVTLRDDYGAWWSYVPHFLSTPGYVYAYAFGELLVLALYNIYQERGEAFVPQYLEVLKAGDSDYPDKILAKVGVDLNDHNFWQNGIEAVRTLINQEESLAKDVYPDKF